MNIKKPKYLVRLKRDNTFQQQQPTCVFQICVYQIWLKRFKDIFEGVEFSKEFKSTPYRHISRTFIAVAEAVTQRHWNYCGPSLAGLFNFQKVRYRVCKKSILKTLFIIFLLANTEWPNLWALKRFSTQLQCIIKHLSKKLVFLNKSPVFKSRGRTNMRKNKLILIRF